MFNKRLGSRARVQFYGMDCRCSPEALRTDAGSIGRLAAARGVSATTVVIDIAAAQ